MDEREQYIAAMDDLKIDKRLGENIAKIVANEAAAEAEERERTRAAETVRAEEKKAKKAKGLTGWRGWQKALAGVFAFVLCMTSAIGIGGGFSDLGRRNVYTPTESVPKDVQTATAKGMIASSYDEIYAALKKTGIFDRSSNYDGIYYYGGIRNFFYTKGGADYALNEAAMPTTPAATASDAAGSPMEDMHSITQTEPQGTDDYSKTNLQVAGVDEADIVKTNGKYIFALGNQTLYIVSAAGENSKLLSTTKLNTEITRPVTDGTKHIQTYPNDMYLVGDTLIVIQTRSTWTEPDWDRYNNDVYYKSYGYRWWYRYDSSTVTEAVFYNVSDPENPTAVTAAAQDGSYLSSRLTNGVLYLITNYNIYSVDENDMPELDPGVYVPRVYYTKENSDATFKGEDDLDSCPLEPSCIAIMPNVSSTQYLVVSGVNATTGDMIGTQSILGGGSQVYMSLNNLYVTLSRYDSEYEDEIREDGTTVRRYTEGDRTDILRIALNNGNPELMATGSLPGSPLNQFSMDEFNGTFRIVTQSYRYTHEEYLRGDGNYVYGGNWTNDDSNAVYVLDMDLNKLGAIEGLSKDERVYSVRFDGTVGYVVTFRQTDPLFAIDFSDPANPAIRSALKIPGFSDYLHVYKQGLLFGLGYDADETTGRTNGMKMSMFDVSDPYDVKEVATLKLGSNYSEALYNHKAILVDSGKSLIAFPADNGYVVYGYDEIAQRFFLKGSIDCTDGMWWGEPRGLYANGYFYVVSVYDVIVLDLDKMTEVTRVELPNDNYKYVEYYDDDVILYD